MEHMDTMSQAFLDLEQRYRNAGILSNNRRSGYYDPNDNSFASQALFRDKTAAEMLKDQKPRYGATYIADASGRRLSDDELTALLERDPNFGINLKTVDKDEAYQTTPVQVTNTTIGQVPTSTFSDAMRNTNAAIVAAAAAPVVLETMGTAAKDIGNYAYRT